MVRRKGSEGRKKGARGGGSERGREKGKQVIKRGESGRRRRE